MRGPRRRLIQATVLLVALAALPYVPFMDGYFLSDDLMLDYFLLEDGSLSTSKLAYHLFPTDGYVGRQIYRPVDFAQLAVDWTFWGTDPFGYHLSNLLFHAASTILVFFLIRRLGGPGGQTFPSVFGGALFALHPLAPEAVQWIVGRVDLTACFFTLVMLLAFVRYRQTERRRFYAISLVALVLALGSKDVAIFAPIYVALFDACRPSNWRAVGGVRRMLATQAGFAAVVVAYLGFRVACFGRLFGKYEAAGQSVGEMMRTRWDEAFANLAQFVHEIAFPIREGAFGSDEAVALWLCLAAGYLAIVGVAVARGLVRGAPPSPGATFAGLWLAATVAPMGYLLLLLPVSSDHLNGRLAYLPLAAFCTAFPLFLFGAARWRERSWRRLRFGAAVLLPAVFAPLTFEHARQFAQAGRDVVAIRDQITACAAERPPATPVVFANPPSETNGVYVLRTGLPFLFRPPFSPVDLPIVGLTLTTDEEFGHFIDAHDHEPLLVRWNESRRVIRAIDPYPGQTLPEWRGRALASWRGEGVGVEPREHAVRFVRPEGVLPKAGGAWEITGPSIRVGPAALATVTVRLALVGAADGVPVVRLGCLDESGAERFVDVPVASVPIDGAIHERRIAVRGRLDLLRVRDEAAAWRFTTRVTRVAIRVPASCSAVVVESVNLSRYPAQLEVVAPADGATLPTDGPVPPFRFRAAPGVAHYRLVLDLPLVGRRTARFARAAAAGTILDKALAGGDNLGPEDFAFDLSTVPAEYRGKGLTFRWWIEALTDPARPWLVEAASEPRIARIE